MGAWRVNFINPAANETSAQLIARRAGEGIEMEGKLSSGTVIRWRYVSITPRLFHYTGERMTPDGKSWHLYLELFGTRAEGRFSRSVTFWPSDVVSVRVVFELAGNGVLNEMRDGR